MYDLIWKLNDDLSVLVFAGNVYKNRSIKISSENVCPQLIYYVGTRVKKRRTTHVPTFIETFPFLTKL